MMAAISGAQTADSLSLQEVVVTGTRNATDVRHLPMTVNVIGRQQLTEQHQTSVLPTVMQQVPGLRPRPFPLRASGDGYSSSNRNI